MNINKLRAILNLSSTQGCTIELFTSEGGDIVIYNDNYRLQDTFKSRYKLIYIDTNNILSYYSSIAINSEEDFEKAREEYKSDPTNWETIPVKDIVSIMIS